MYKGNKDKFGVAQLEEMEKRKTLSHIRTPDEINDNLDKDKVVPGAKVYANYCRSCHQRDGKGDGLRFPPLDSSEWVNGDKKRLINVVLHGLQGPVEVKGQPYNGSMPQHTFLKDEDIAQVLTYIRQNFGNNASAVNPADVNKLRNTVKK